MFLRIVGKWIYYSRRRHRRWRFWWFWSTTHRNHFHSKMVLEYNSHKSFPRQNGFGILVRWWWRWWWWTTVLMMRLKILVVMMMNDGDDLVCFRVWFVLFCLVFFWGCRKQLCWDLCTVHKDFLMRHNRSRIKRLHDFICLKYIITVAVGFIAFIFPT